MLALYRTNKSTEFADTCVCIVFFKSKDDREKVSSLAMNQLRQRNNFVETVVRRQDLGKLHNTGLDYIVTCENYLEVHNRTMKRVVNENNFIEELETSQTLHNAPKFIKGMAIN